MSCRGFHLKLFSLLTSKKEIRKKQNKENFQLHEICRVRPLFSFSQRHKFLTMKGHTFFRTIASVEEDEKDEEYNNKTGYTANPSCGRVGRGGNARFHTF